MYNFLIIILKFSIKKSFLMKVLKNVHHQGKVKCGNMIVHRCKKRLNIKSLSPDSEIWVKWLIRTGPVFSPSHFWSLVKRHDQKGKFVSVL